jgi:hypothetical protein
MLVVFIPSYQLVHVSKQLCGLKTIDRNNGMGIVLIETLSGKQTEILEESRI